MVVVTVLFNGYKLCPKRVQRCIEFIEKWPNVILITNVPNLPVECLYYPLNEVGFIDYHLINLYLEEYQPDSLTYIDNDLYLPDDYFLKLENCTWDPEYDPRPRIRQGFSQCFEVSDKIRLAPSIVMNTIDGTFFGHTGYCWSFNKQMLELIDYHFPECFLLGGFDFFLAKCMKRKYEPLLPDPELAEYYKKFHSAKFSYLKVDIEHIYHGPQNKRLTPFDCYSRDDNIVKHFIHKINS